MKPCGIQRRSAPISPKPTSPCWPGASPSTALPTSPAAPSLPPASWPAQLGYGEHDQELARIAGFMHDIGNVVNRHDHAQTGAVMAFRILDKMGMEPADVAAVITAIGHHDDPTAFPVNPVAAALILADKTDVRRSRVRNKEHQSFDIHDRVNYAAERSELTLDPERRTLTLSLGINTEFCAVMDYFEIFLERMLLCRRAAEFLELTFKLDINGLSLL